MLRTRIACALAAAGVAAVAPTVAIAAGPSPGVVVGGGGVLARDGGVRYVALDAGAATALAAVRVRDGVVLRQGSLGGSFGVPRVAFDGSADGLTRDGTRLVLATYAGLQPKLTEFAVVSTKTLRRQQLVTLPGAWSFDALSPDGRTMYLIQYLAASGGARYRVRAYDLAAGRLLAAPIVDRTEPGPMVGSPVTRLTSPDGTWAFTLYARDAGVPFVHALDTVHRAARCIDLDRWRGPATAIWKVRLALSANGKRLLVRDRSGATKLAVAVPG